MSTPEPPTGSFGEPQDWGPTPGELGRFEQPNSLRLAVRGMWVGAALSLFGIIVAFVQKDEIREQIAENADEPLTADELDTAVAIALTIAGLVGAIAIGLWIWMATTNGQGKAWARTTATVLGVLNVVFTLIGIAMGQATAFGLVISVVTVALAIGILVMLYRPESNSFYDAVSRQQMYG